LLVTFGPLVLTTIDLNDKGPFPTRKVSNKRSDRKLPDELAAFKLSIAQGGPELSFCIGAPFAELPRSFRELAG